MRIVKIPAIFLIATDVGCVAIRKCIFNGTGLSNNHFQKNAF